jgi:hypothetical protein
MAYSEYGNTGLPVIGLGDFINQAEAAAMVLAAPGGIIHYTVFGKAAIERLMVGDQVQGVRIYIAQESGGLNVVLVPVDEFGQDMINMFNVAIPPDRFTVKGKPTVMEARILNRGVPCPPKCIGAGPGSGSNGGGSW